VNNDNDEYSCEQQFQRDLTVSKLKVKWWQHLINKPFFRWFHCALEIWVRILVSIYKQLLFARDSTEFGLVNYDNNEHSKKQWSPRDFTELEIVSEMMSTSQYNYFSAIPLWLEKWEYE
jgi:hypothetical protein